MTNRPPRPAGRHFLQIPGPTNVPDRVLRAIDRPTIDHRGPEFARLGRDVLDRIRLVFQTRSPVVIYGASGARRSSSTARRVRALGRPRW